MVLRITRRPCRESHVLGYMTSDDFPMNNGTSHNLLLSDTDPGTSTALRLRPGARFRCSHAGRLDKCFAPLKEADKRSNVDDS
jgi:hypothetical protein